jgi:hypothetical protein
MNVPPRGLGEKAQQFLEVRGISLAVGHSTFQRNNEHSDRIFRAASICYPLAGSAMLAA